MTATFTIMHTDKTKRETMNYWLMKTEPSVFSWDDLQKMPNQITQWEGVRNYQARNFMRDGMKLGDRVFFYHSVEKPQSIMGIAKVVREAYPDHFSLDPKSDYYDPKSTSDNPRWLMVDIQWERSFSPPITLEELKAIPTLEKMMLLQKGSRLSVQPVTTEEWKLICQLR
jgi:predicted RNA-binding protein with PUA-like domain